jgi:hypothetical protein
MKMSPSQIKSTMNHWYRIALACSALTTMSASCLAEFDPTFITFGEVDRDIGNDGPIVEGDYQYDAVGASWSLQDGGPPAPLDPFPNGAALVTFWGTPPAVGNVIRFSRLDGKWFSFLSLELRGRLPDVRNDVVLARGFLNGAEVASQLFQSSDEAWRLAPANSSFSSALDELRIELVEYNLSALILDNLAFALVPEPNACLLLAIGVSALAQLRRRRAA